mmetsp:Transcript_6248/g.10616  ORF Transcript_6248/g.10616 Transcript_6248/m.10616 type:complete len:209 (-) Transcript_6248:84-710(-)
MTQFDDSQKFLKFTFAKDFKMHSNEIELYRAPKILGDVFEAIIGAIFIDGGIKAVIEVLRPLLSPFILFVAKHSKSIFKEPKEDFEQLAVQLNIKPQFQSYKATQYEKRLGDLISVAPEDEAVTDKLFKVDIIFQQGMIMETGYGSTNLQAERNASIKGLQWLHTHKGDKIQELLHKQQFQQSLRGCFMQHKNLNSRVTQFQGAQGQN